MANIRGSSVQSRGQLTEDIQKDSGGSRADVFSAGWSDNKAFWRDFKRDTPGAVLESDEEASQWSLQEGQWRDHCHYCCAIS